MQQRRRRSFEHSGHSNATRTSHSIFSGPRNNCSHLSRSSLHRSLPHLTSSVVGNQLPGFLVGRPWIKQYISQVSAPSRSALSTAFSQSSLVRLLSVSSKVLWILFSFRCQNILKIHCSALLKPLRYGFAKSAVARTGGSCHKSPAKMMLMPPKGRRCLEEPSTRVAEAASAPARAALRAADV